MLRWLEFDNYIECNEKCTKLPIKNIVNDFLGFGDLFEGVVNQISAAHTPLSTFAASTVKSVAIITVTAKFDTGAV